MSISSFLVIFTWARGAYTQVLSFARPIVPSARAHRFARVVPLPQAVQQGVVPAPLYEGDGWRGALAVLEYPRREVTAQRRSVEVGTGGELFAPVDESLA